jgi:hypothetical protein
MQKKISDIILAELVGRAFIMLGKSTDSISIAFSGPLCIPVQLHVFHHPFSQVCHNNPPLM